ncbi:MAG TPA: hypothetical protein PK771_06625 [Spirochaetota bacterium]|nr:hypothetical protein [Spirochaetota bacterium]
MKKMVFYFILFYFISINLYSNINKDLIKAVKDGNFEIVKELIKDGANPKAKDDNGYDAITWAQVYDRNDIYNYLVSLNNNDEFK